MDQVEAGNIIPEMSKRRESVGSRLSEKQKNEIQKRVDGWDPKRLFSSGTGFHINANHILTNAHVVRSADELRIPYHRVEIVAVDEDAPWPYCLIRWESGYRNIQELSSCFRRKGSRIRISPE